MNETRAIFLDRDGVINRDSEACVRTFDEFVYLPWAERAFRILGEIDLPIVVVTNQSAIGRGHTTEEIVARIHEKLIADAASWGARIVAAEYCPHVPEDECSCRKPATLLFERAAQRHRLAFSGSWMVGDKGTDVEAGLRLGMKTIRVTTGIHGHKPGPEPSYRVADFLSAAERIARDEMHS